MRVVQYGSHATFFGQHLCEKKKYNIYRENARVIFFTNVKNKKLVSVLSRSTTTVAVVTRARAHYTNQK